MKKTVLKGSVYVFFVDYNAVDTRLFQFMKEIS